MASLGFRADMALSSIAEMCLDSGISKEQGRLTVHHGILERVDSVPDDQCYKLVSWMPTGNKVLREARCAAGVDVEGMDKVGSAESRRHKRRIYLKTYQRRRMEQLVWLVEVLATSGKDTV